MEKIQLTYPVEINGQTTNELNVRRPKVRDMLVADKAQGSEAEKEIRMFANLCEVEPGVIEGLDLIDYSNLQKVYQGFLS